jgi:hypothetical protein
MNKFVKSVTFFLCLTIISYSCRTKSDVKRGVERYNTVFRFTNGFHDTVTATLNLDTIRDEVVVRSIGLSNNQKLIFLDSLPRNPHFFKFETIDLNFDGYQDIRTLRETGATGNVWHDTWLYLPLDHKWVYSQFLSSAPSVVIDSVSKKILSSYQGGFSENMLVVYKVVKDTLFKPTANMRSEYRSGVFFISYTDYSSRKVLFRDTSKMSTDLLNLYDSIVHTLKTN